MDEALIESLLKTLGDHGPMEAASHLCDKLREAKDYSSLFYALLVRKRLELGVSPVPTEAAYSLPEAFHERYETGIRDAARQVGELCIAGKNLPLAWMYYRMIGEPGPVAQALEGYQVEPEEDPQALIDIAFHQGVLPRKGFDWILERYGICSAITLASGTEFADADVRTYCIRKLVRALYSQLAERLVEEIAGRDNIRLPADSLAALMHERDWLFESEFAHIDVSHLHSVVQMSIGLHVCDELRMARELCRYGSRLHSRLQYAGEPPFEDFYKAHEIYLSVLAGEDVESGIAYFKDKLESYDPDQIGSLPCDILVNLLLRIGRPGEAAQITRQHLRQAENLRNSSPSLAELCRLAGDYRSLIEAARQQGDPVHFLAGTLAQRQLEAKKK